MEEEEEEEEAQEEEEEEELFFCRLTCQLTVVLPPPAGRDRKLP